MKKLTKKQFEKVSEVEAMADETFYILRPKLLQKLLNEEYLIESDLSYIQKITLILKCYAEIYLEIGYIIDKDLILKSLTNALKSIEKR